MQESIERCQYEGDTKEEVDGVEVGTSRIVFAPTAAEHLDHLDDDDDEEGGDLHVAEVIDWEDSPWAYDAEVGKGEKTGANKRA